MVVRDIISCNSHVIELRTAVYLCMQKFVDMTAWRSGRVVRMLNLCCSGSYPEVAGSNPGIKFLNSSLMRAVASSKRVTVAKNKILIILEFLHGRSRYHQL